MIEQIAQQIAHQAPGLAVAFGIVIQFLRFLREERLERADYVRRMESCIDRLSKAVETCPVNPNIVQKKV